MDRKKKALWFSIFLTGAGQLYLGEKKKGLSFLMFSLLGVFIWSIGVILALGTLLGLTGPLLLYYRVFFYTGIFLSIIGLALIVISGYKSIRDILSR